MKRDKNESYLFSWCLECDEPKCCSVSEMKLEKTSGSVISKI
jgi:hypothetical protein